MISTDADESLTFDKKSIRSFTSQRNKCNWREIAKDCVAFANAKGGAIVYGVENDSTEPPPDLRIQTSFCTYFEKQVGNLTRNVFVEATVQQHHNGGEFLHVKVFPSEKSIASTSDGRYYLRSGDESKPLMPDELVRLLPDKASFRWESQTRRNTPAKQADEVKLRQFLQALRASDRVKEFTKQLSDEEIIESYNFVVDGFLTNLGVLWIGKQHDRASLVYSPVIHFIKYNERHEKISKKSWDDYSLNPAELVEAIWTEIPEWKEYIELPDGLYRKQIPHYDEVVVRELLINALVHRPYTTGGDIFINLHPDYFEIRNPGRLPLGVSPQNILQKSIRRNELLARIFHDLKLMEREGSGYDRVYEALLLQGKKPPIVREDDDSVCVTVGKSIIDSHLALFLEGIDRNYDLSLREKIALGLIAQKTSLTALEFARLLQLDGEERLQNWIGRLVSQDIILSQGKTKGTEYFVNASILRNAKFNGKTTLKRIEMPRLKQLVLEDLKIHGPNAQHTSPRRDIHKRIGEDIPLSKLRHAIEALVADGVIHNTHKRGMGGGYYVNDVDK